jgi:uncharacterized HAD superfamily protein
MGIEDKKRLCIDIDNVLAQTDALIRKIIKDATKSRVCLAYKDITDFEYEKCTDSKGNKITKEEWHRVHDIFSEETNIMSLQPFPNIQFHLGNLINSGYELHLATSRKDKARIPTIKWLEKYKFPNHSLHFVNHREKHLILGKFSAVVEDDLQQARDFAQTGTPAYLIAHPWNVTDNIKGIFRARDWKEISEQLQSKYH